MKTKKVLLMLTAVSLLAPVAAFAAEEPNDLAAPTWTSITLAEDDITFDWEPVTGAAKYSVDIEGLAIYWDDSLDDYAEAEVEVSLGTGVWNEDMSESELTIDIDDLGEVIAIELGFSADDILWVLTDPEEAQASAKVKALGSTGQDNPFSVSESLPHDIVFVDII